MQHPVRENFRRWTDAVHAGDPEAVAALYADEQLTFLPTLGRRLMTSRAAALEYFRFFLSLQPRAELLEERSVALDPSTYLHCGMYRFTLGPDAQRQSVETRFTFVWRRSGVGEWKILHHHSSRMPEPV